jgi:hypothetical protein
MKVVRAEQIKMKAKTMVLAAAVVMVVQERLRQKALPIQQVLRVKQGNVRKGVCPRNHGITLRPMNLIEVVWPSISWSS